MSLDADWAAVFRSPEVFQEKPYTRPSDIWAMGCLFFELCERKVPFDAPNIAGLAHKICCGPAPQVTSGYSDFVRCLRSELLDRYPARAQRGDNSVEVIQEVVRQMLNEAQAGESIELNHAAADCYEAWALYTAAMILFYWCFTSSRTRKRGKQKKPAPRSRHWERSTCRALRPSSSSRDWQRCTASTPLASEGYAEPKMVNAITGTIPYRSAAGKQAVRINDGHLLPGDRDLGILRGASRAAGAEEGFGGLVRRSR